MLGPVWEVTVWSNCSSSFDCKGLKFREVSCVWGDAVVVDVHCSDISQKPENTFNCWVCDPNVWVSQNILNFTEGEEVSVDIMLNTAPADDLVWMPEDIVALKEKLLFYPEFPLVFKAGVKKQVLRIYARNNALNDGAAFFDYFINGSFISNHLSDQPFESLNVTINARVYDDDVVDWSVFPTKAVITEGDSAQISVIFASQPQVAINVSLCDSGLLSSALETNLPLIIPPNSWGDSHVVSIAVPDNNVATSISLGSANHSLCLDLVTADSGYSKLNSKEIFLTVVDDDKAGLLLSRLDVLVSVDPTVIGTDEIIGTVVNSYSLQLASAPQFPVNVSIVPLDGTPVFTRPTFAVFSNDTWNVDITVTVVASDEAAYVSKYFKGQLNHVLQSEDPLYDGLAEAPGVRVTLLKGNIPPPSLLSATFSSDGRMMSVTFSSDTDRGQLPSVCDCTTVFNVDVVKDYDSLGKSSSCIWVSGKEIQVLFGSGATFKPGDFLTLLNLAIRRFGANADDLYASGSVKTFAPSVPEAPIVSLSGPGTLGSCDDLVLDARGSTGGGGRPLSFHWSLVSSNSELDNGGGLARVQKLLAGQNSVLYADRVVFTRDMLEPGIEYTFRVAVTTFLGRRASSADFVVSKANDPLPFLSIKGSSELTITCDKPLKLSVAASAPTCADQTASKKLVFTWEQVSGDLMSLPQQRNPRELSFLEYAFTPSLTYVFRVSVALKSTSQTGNSSALITVHVNHSPIDLTVVGGNMSVSALESVVQLKGVINDPRWLGNVESMEGVVMKWWCRYCFSSSDELELLLFGNASLNLNVNALLKNRTLNFILQAELPDRRAKNVSAWLIVQEAPQLKVTIAPWPKRLAKYNPFKSFKAQCEFIDLPDGLELEQITYEWSLVQGDVELADVSRTQLTQKVLALKKNSLTPGAVYILRATATATNTVYGSGFADYHISMMLPPSSGEFTVTPAEGEAGSTDFDFSALHWAGEGMLAYSFGYVVLNDDETTSDAILSAKHYVPGVTLKLPVGNPGNDNELTVWLTVQDLNGVRARATAVVKVNPPIVQNLNEFVGSVLNDGSLSIALEESSGGEALSIITTLSSLFRGNGNDTNFNESCSGNGNYTAQYDCKIRVCEKKCVCNDGFTGPLCNIIMDQLEERANATEKLLSAYLEAGKYMEKSAEAFSQQAEVLKSLTSDGESLNKGSQVKAIDALRMFTSTSDVSFETDNETTTTAVNDVLLEPDAVLAVANTLSNLLSGSVLQEPSAGDAEEEVAKMSSTLSGAANLVGKSLLADVVPGEPKVELHGGLLKFGLTRIEKANYNKTHLFDVSTESLSAISFVNTFSFGSKTNASYVDVQVLRWGKNPYSWANDSSGGEFVSAVTGFTVFDASYAEIDMSGLDSPLKIQLPLEIELPKSDVDTHVVICTLTPEHIDVACPYDFTYHHYCNGSVSYETNYTCPYFDVVGLCSSWDPSINKFADTGCQLLSLSETEITCHCDRAGDFTGKLVQPLVDSLAIISGITSLDWSDLKANWVVLTVLLGVYGIFTLMAIYSYKLDERAKRKISPLILEANDAILDNTKFRDHNSVSKTHEIVEGDTLAVLHNCDLSFVGKTKILLARGFKKEHKFASIFAYDENFSRPKRVLILLLMVMTFMFLEAFFFSWQYSSLDELREEAAIAVEMPEIKLPEFSTDMIFGILAAIVAIPPELFFISLLMRAGKKPAHYEKDIREAVRHLDGLDGKKGTRTVTAWEKLQKARIMEWCARHPSGEEVVDIVEDELKSAKAKVSFWDLAKTATKEKGKGGKKLTDFGGVVNTLGKTARRKKLKLLLKTARENVQLATAKVDAELKEMRAKTRDAMKENIKLASHRSMKTFSQAARASLKMVKMTNAERKVAERSAFIEKQLTGFKKWLFLRFLQHRAEERKKLFPCWIDKIVFMLCISYSVSAGLFVFLFGVYYGPEITNAWLVALLTATFSDSVILDPLKIVLLSVLIPVMASTIVNLARFKNLQNDNERQNIFLKMEEGIENPKSKSKFNELQPAIPVNVVHKHNDSVNVLHHLSVQKTAGTGKRLRESVLVSPAVTIHRNKDREDLWCDHAGTVGCEARWPARAAPLPPDPVAAASTATVTVHDAQQVSEAVAAPIAATTATVEHRETMSASAANQSAPKQLCYVKVENSKCGFWGPYELKLLKTGLVNGIIGRGVNVRIGKHGDFIPLEEMDIAMR